MTRKNHIWMVGLLVIFVWIVAAYAQSPGFKENNYPVGKLKPRDSVLKVKVGENVVISFVPAAWTPVCSDQWPGYNIAKEYFDQSNAILLGITVDNIPTLYAWTNQMCMGGGTLWFPVLSDFYPHGAVAKKFGILRSDGVSERALFVIDKKGIIRYIDVHDINTRPRLEVLVGELQKLEK
jgi:alkyl hydroperoxide reductase subunit AhpC